MRKFTILLCGMLCCFQAFCQEAEQSASESQWLIIPRVEINPYAALKDGGKTGYDFSNTSLYTLFEGGLGDSNFSYSVEGHLLSDSPASLYQNAFYSQEATFIDWAKLTYTLGQWDFNIGKDVVALGTYEYDEYDFDSHINLSSTAWSNLQPYQYGASVGYTTANEANHFTGMFHSSPFGEHPFYTKSAMRPLYGYSLGHRGEYDSFETFNSVNMWEYEPGAFVYVAALGFKVPVSESFTFGADFMSRGFDKPSFLGQEGEILASVKYEPSDSFCLTVKGGYEFCKGEDVFGYIDEEDPLMLDAFVPTSLSLLGKGYTFGGVAAHWFPTENLRVHGVVVANNFAKSLSFNIGATYYFDLRNIF